MQSRSVRILSLSALAGVALVRAGLSAPMW